MQNRADPWRSSLLLLTLNLSWHFLIVPETAKEILNNSAFADRPVKESAYELLFHRAMGFALYGDYWCNLRRILSTHFFSPKRVAGFGAFRKNIGLKMVSQVLSSVEENGIVEVKKILHFASLNNVTMSVFGKYYDDFSENCGSGDGHELEKLVSKGYELLGIFSWNDHFPIVRWFDFQGISTTIIWDYNKGQFVCVLSALILI